MGIVSEGIKEVVKKIPVKFLSIPVVVYVGTKTGQVISRIVDAPTRIKAMESSLRKNKRRFTI